MMQYPLLKPGALVKPQIFGGRFTWLPVISDPGPADDRTRRITLQGRAVIKLRRDRVSTGVARSTFDTVFTPPPGDVQVERKPKKRKYERRTTDTDR